MEMILRIISLQKEKQIKKFSVQWIFFVHYVISFGFFDGQHQRGKYHSDDRSPSLPSPS